MWAFSQHLIRPEKDVEADPGLSFVGQGRLESKQVEVVVQKRKEVAQDGMDRWEGWGSQWRERIDMMGRREE